MNEYGSKFRKWKRMYKSKWNFFLPLPTPSHPLFLSVGKVLLIFLCIFQRYLRHKSNVGWEKERIPFPPFLYQWYQMSRKRIWRRALNISKSLANRLVTLIYSNHKNLFRSCILCLLIVVIILFGVRDPFWIYYENNGSSP